MAVLKFETFDFQSDNQNMPRGKPVETFFHSRILKTCNFLLIHIAFKIIALIEVPCFVSVKTNAAVKLVS